MPPEPKAKLKRRSSRREIEEYKFDGGHARELELKRSRGEVSCAECRRLKIKCDKQNQGSLATGQGTRFVLAATEHLHRRIARLSGRIRELEDALSTMHTKYAPDDQQPHPLLESDWLLEAEEDGNDDDELEPGSNRGRKIGKLPSDLHGRPISVGALGDGDAMDEGVDSAMFKRRSRERLGSTTGGEVIDAFGTLSISNHGISRFFGPTGGSESLLIASLPSTESSPALSQNQLRNSASPIAGFERETSSLSPSSTHNSHQSQATSSTSNVQPSVNAFSSAATVSSGSMGPVDPRITLFSHHFPFTPLALPPAQIQELIESYLPTYERARDIVGTYFEQVAWLFRGVSREQLEGEMMEAIYARKHARDRGEMVMKVQKSNCATLVQWILLHSMEETTVAHIDLALLFLIFAVGALVEPFPASGSSSDSPGPVPSPGGSSPYSNASAAVASRPTPNTLGEHYLQLAQAALSLQPVLEKPSIVTIQCLHVMSIYNAMSGEGTASPSSSADSDSTSTAEPKTGQSETSMEMTWSLITMAAHLSQTIGLHRDSERWGLSPKMVQRRRILFWDLFVADVWQSLNTGRPPSFSLAYIDCSFPQYEGVNKKDGGQKDSSPPTNRGATAYEKMEKAKKEGYAFEIWQFRFASECVAEVISRTLTAEAPTYATIMELDRKVREFPLPDGFTDRGAGSSAKDAGFGGVSNSGMKYNNPPTAESEVLMYIHRSFFAQAIIEQPTNPLKSVYAPSFLAAYRASATILKSIREQFIVWPNSCARFWTMWTFAFSAAVTRGPRSPLAASAMTELDQACLLFSKAAMYSKRATKALSKNPEPSLSDGELWNIKKEEVDPTMNCPSLQCGSWLFRPRREFCSEECWTIIKFHSTSSEYGYQPYMEPSSSYDVPQSYQHQPPLSHQPPPPLRPLHQRPSVLHSGPYQSDDRSPESSSMNGWYGQNTRHREDYDMHPQHNHPPTISIPPAPMSSSVDESSPHQHMQFNYSYDRSSRSGPSPPAQSNQSWSSSRPPSQSYPSRHSSSPIRLTHPQYGHPSSQVHPPENTSMSNFHHQSAPYQMYTGPGVAGFGPPPPLHLHPMHPPGHDALADLGLSV
ncbi:hypothetical protein BT96DRAFT_932215 [Gymnopus androsaceus JB14]|uniref:Xylanolytic transcriptional activator regulatory domain-containing protein n=1 Tax=Gymnopus androsaceus JB14 TaxID=1447944 RepID=A0A6A4IK33_9AGAR|nr:hypothetical protein BT96DRAFT_932215 [Gymnopus androsaceus JB14]